MEQHASGNGDYVQEPHQVVQIGLIGSEQHRVVAAEQTDEGIIIIEQIE